MKRFSYILVVSLALTLLASSCMSSRSTAGRGCKINSGMVGYR